MKISLDNHDNFTLMSNPTTPRRTPISPLNEKMNWSTFSSDSNILKKDQTKKKPLHIFTPEEVEFMKKITIYKVNLMEFSHFSDIIKRKPIKNSSFSCFSKPKELNKWWLECDLIKIIANAYHETVYHELKNSDQILLQKEILKLIKSGPKFNRLSFQCNSINSSNLFFQLIEKVLFSYQKINCLNQFLINFVLDEDYLWHGPKFIYSNFLNPSFQIIPLIDPVFSLQHLNKENLDHGLKIDKIEEFLKICYKNSGKFKDLQVIHFKISNWMNLNDRILLQISKIIEILGQSLRELTLYFSGAKITDLGIENIIESIKLNKNLRKIISFNIGFDVRTSLVSDISLKNIIEGILYLSQHTTLQSISICFIGKDISDFGVWCLSIGLAKIIESVVNLVIIIGSENKITDEGVESLINMLEKGKKIRNLSIGIFSSGISDAGIRLICKKICNFCNNLEQINIYYNNKGRKNEIIENKILAFFNKKYQNLKKKEIQVFIDN